MSKSKTAADLKQLEERIQELQAVDVAEAERQATLARLLAEKQAVEQAHELELIEAEIKELLPKYERARQDLVNRSELLLKDLQKLMADYKKEVGDKVAPLNRLKSRLAVLGRPAKSMEDIPSSAKLWVLSLAAKVSI